jgi:hypothetical protein
MRGKFPTCHALAVVDPITGALGRGFRVRDLACEDCPVKFSCLPHSIKRKVSDATLEQDGEVEAFVNGRISYEFGLGRIAGRQALRARGERVPPELSPRVRILSESEIAPEPRWKVISRGRPSHFRVRMNAQGIYRQYSPSDMPLPLPAEIDADRMDARLARTDIGQNVPLRIGMSVHREVRKGPLAGLTVIIAFRENGFETDGCLFGSLSSAVTHHLGYNRAAKGFIDLRKDSARLYDQHGQLIQ